MSVPSPASLAAVFAFSLGNAAAQVPDQLKETLPPSSAASQAQADTFGIATAISGTRVVIGALFDDRWGVDAGSAYVYDLASGTPALPVAALQNLSPAQFDRFGAAVGISGSRVIVGAYGDDLAGANTGGAYVFDLAGLNPAQPAFVIPNPSPVPGQGFGIAVGISGTRAVVGNWQESTGGASAGSAYVYDLAGANPTLPALTLHNPAPGPSDFFGEAVAIDGQIVVVGAYWDDTGATNAGSVYVYDLGSATPAVAAVVLNHPAPQADDQFGDAIAVSGTRVVVGVPYADGGMPSCGRVYVYDLAGAAPAVPVMTLQPPVPQAGGGFGSAVAISGTRIVVGAILDGTSGLYLRSAYVFDLASPTPGAPVAVLCKSMPSSTDSFGYAVGVDGATVVVGAPGDSSFASGKGAAYVFAPSPFSLWKANVLADAFASTLGDEEGDGLLNLTEYALVQPPKTASTAPPAEPHVYPDGRRLRMVFTRDPTRDDVNVEVLAAGDVAGPWTVIASSPLGAPTSGTGYVAGDGPGPGLKTVEVRDVVKIDEASQRFMRLRVSR